MPIPVPATFAATRTAPPSGSEPCERAAAAPERGAPPAAVRALPAPAVDRRAEPAAPARFADERAPDERLADEPGPPPFDRAPPPLPAAPPAAARLSLRLPGRERGRLPITPGSSVTAGEYERGVPRPSRSCAETRRFARERRVGGVYSCTAWRGRRTAAASLAPRWPGHVDRQNSTAYTGHA